MNGFICKTTNFTNRIFSLIMLGIVLLITVVNCLAVTSAEEMNKYLIRNLLFSKDDISKLEAGEMILKQIPVNDKREVAVCGLVSINASPEIGLKAFQEAMLQQNKKSVKAFGNFSEIPKLEDIQSLKLEKKDIEDLKNCRIGDCKLKLSAAMIERFQKEINWNSADYANQVNQLFREMILEYLKNYLLQGNSALIEYQSQDNIISLENEQKSLLKKLLLIDEFDPQLSEYLKNFPDNKPQNVRTSITWTKIDFGLKPIIILTQNFTRTFEQNGVLKILFVSKQLYASRYLDSSLGLTTLVRFGQTEKKSFLFYTNRSRSSSLDGLLSKFKHGIVDQEAIKKMEELLLGTKVLAETVGRSQSPKPEESFQSAKVEKNYLIYFLGLAGVAVIVFLIGKAILTKQKSESARKNNELEINKRTITN